MCKHKKQGKQQHDDSNMDDRLALEVKGCRQSPGGTYNKADTLLGLSWEKPEDLPKNARQGPQLPRYREWAPAMRRCRSAGAGAHKDQRKDVIDQADGKWSNAAEEELELLTGACLKKKGTRGKPPDMAVRPISVQRRRARLRCCLCGSGRSSVCENQGYKHQGGREQWQRQVRSTSGLGAQPTGNVCVARPAGLEREKDRVAQAGPSTCAECLCTHWATALGLARWRAERWSSGAPCAGRGGREGPQEI